MPQSITICFQEPADPPPIIDTLLGDTVLRFEGILYPIKKIIAANDVLGITIVDPLIRLLQQVAQADSEVDPLPGRNILSHVTVYDQPEPVLSRMLRSNLLSQQQYLACMVLSKP